jgi:cyclopropane fatty-acyl-phospholipid synthase-like methyltransferase
MNINKPEIISLIKEIKKAMVKILEENINAKLSDDNQNNLRSINNATDKLLKIFEMPNSQENSQEEFEKLKSLLHSEQWTEAVPAFQIVDQNSEEEKISRAEAIVDILIEDLIENKKVLDFGCGEGHISKYISTEKASISVGYDIEQPKNSKFNWENKENNFLLTTNFEKVKEEGPYDIIILYDVIDHLQGENSKLLSRKVSRKEGSGFSSKDFEINDDIKTEESILSKIKSLINEDGKIYMRCHPWCSRHGGHLYRQINKAFVHLVFTEEELNSMGYKIEETNLKIIFPIIEYEKMILESGLKINKLEIETQQHESFFEKNELISKRIKKNIPIENGKTFPSYQISQCFHDYILSK